jgi:hypothetical protein
MEPLNALSLAREGVESTPPGEMSIRELCKAIISSQRSEIDQQHLHLARAEPRADSFPARPYGLGNVTTEDAPRFALFSAPIVPPCASTMRFTILPD